MTASVATGRRRGRTGKASQGSAPACADPRGWAEQSSRPPAPATARELLRSLRGAPPSGTRYERKAGASPCLPLRWGRAAARHPAGTRRSHSAFSRQSLVFGKGHLCSSSTASALEGSVQLGLGQTAQVWELPLCTREVIPLLLPFQPSQDVKLQLQCNGLVKLKLVSISPDSQAHQPILQLQTRVSPLVQFTALNLLFVEMYFFLPGKINHYHHLLHSFSMLVELVLRQRNMHQFPDLKDFKPTILTSY